MDEFDIIARYFAPLATRPGAFALKDDAAAIPARPGFDLIVTTDQLAEGTDFFRHDPAATIAQKALRVNLSDLAAKGAVPDCYLLAMALPQDMTQTWLAEFATGLGRDQLRYGVSLLGGDTSATHGPLMITITAFGFVPEDRMLRRSGARIGNAVYVTGAIGDSAGGLAILKREKHRLTEAQRDDLIGHYRIPQPPIVFGAALQDLATASVDVSDGLVADLGHIAAASRAQIEIDAELIPRSQALRALWGDEPRAILRAATGGDDYQIAFAADPARDGDIRAAAARADVAVTRIGAVKSGEGVTILHRGIALTVPKAGYRHFS